MRTTVTAVLFLYAVFVVFAHLDDHQLEYYDEARTAVNAVEMARGDSHWLVPTYAGEPDYFGVKPPLQVWLEAGFIQLLGVGTLAVRLPAALASVGLVLLLMWWGKRDWPGGALTGALAGVIMFCSVDWMGTHGARSGDQDALLILLLTGQVACAYRYVKSGETKYVIWLGLAVLLAGYTKGIAGGFLLPGIGLWFLTSPEGRRKLLRPGIYLSVGLAIALVAIYYPIRESLDPGFIDWVRHHEWGGRFRGYDAGHDQPYFFYVIRMLNDAGFTYFLALFPFAAFVAFSGKDRLDPARMCTIVALVFLIIVSAAATKLYWYKSPAMPLIAAVVAAGLIRLGEALTPDDGRTPWKTLLLYAGIFLIPMTTVLEIVLNPRDHQSTSYHKFPYRKFMRSEGVSPPYTVLAREYNPNARFDVEAARDAGQDVQLKYARTALFPCATAAGAVAADFVPGERVIVCHQETWEYLSERYETFDKVKQHPCKLVLVHRAKGATN